MTKRTVRKSVSQTPAPKKDRVFGSRVNRSGSASKPNVNIKFADETTDKIRNIIKGTGVPLGVAKSVVRRGFGAYSVSHRPGISRVGWGLARLKTFIKKFQGKPVKAAYKQDDDLLRSI